MGVKKIILYGVRSNRLFIEKNLSRNYEIVGYTDSDSRYDELEEYDYKVFYQVKKLKYAEFDYVLIVPQKDNAMNEIFDVLIQNEVDIEKIIKVGDFELDFRNPLKEFYNLHRCFDGIVLGMSHAYSGFLTHYFSEKFFKFAAPSMDLYFHLHILKKIFSSDLSGKIKYIVFELPYYIFNYDLSKCKKIAKIRMNYMDIFNDYHHYGENDDEMRNIRFYKVLKDMFGWDENYVLSSNNFESNRIALHCNESTNEHIKYCRDHSWYKIEPKTIEENVVIWHNILALIRKRFSEIKIAIVIYPQNPLMIKHHGTTISNMKGIFYEHILDGNDNNILIYDYFSMLPEHSFIDQCHMNTAACIDFSRLLDRKFKKDFYE